MNLTLRPYKASDATTIVSWIKMSILCASGALTDMSIILLPRKI